MSDYCFYRNERLNQPRRNMERSNRLRKDRVLQQLIESHCRLMAEVHEKRGVDISKLIGAVEQAAKEVSAERRAKRETIQ